jgi:hypothetical protein
MVNYSEMVYFECAHFAHIVQYREHIRVKRMAARHPSSLEKILHIAARAASRAPDPGMT